MVALDARGGPRFVEEATRAIRRRGVLFGDDLQGDAPLEEVVTCLVHRAHRALPDETLEPILTGDDRADAERLHSQRIRPGEVEPLVFDGADVSMPESLATAVPTTQLDLSPLTRGTPPRCCRGEAFLWALQPATG